MNQKNLYAVVKINGKISIGEKKTHYLLPIANPKALCIMLNYLYRHGELPSARGTPFWWDKKEFQEYYEEDEENDRE